MSEDTRFQHNHKMPEEINKKLKKVYEEVGQVTELITEILKSTMDCNASFKYSHNAIGPLLNVFEREQIICFTNRYTNLPEFNNLEIEKREKGFFISNIPELRHLINEYRSIISNKSDAIYYAKIHKLCREKLLNNPEQGLSIRVITDDERDITQDFLNMLNEKSKAIGLTLKHCDHEYLYNGVLQHSDSKYTERLLRDNSSGQLNYIFIKNAMLLTLIKQLLYWHCFILIKLAGSTLAAL